MGCEQFSLAYKFLSQALKILENTFQDSNKTGNFPDSHSLTHALSLSLSPCPLPLSLSLSFSCTKYLFDQKTRENKNQLINKTSSLNNKSFYKVLNTQLRITLGVLFFYDAFVELNGRMLRLSPGERSLALMARGLLPANVGRTRVLDELVIHSVCREHYCYCNGKLRSLKTRTMRSGQCHNCQGEKGKNYKGHDLPFKIFTFKLPKRI